ncbi:TIGR01906 family membrane protein [Trichococcus ilyis]|uniref:TIGR01906 family membrane protein n=1 Tax=Trichococcus ilyis TaxID=640938 RepID=UPI003B8474CC
MTFFLLSLSIAATINFSFLYSFDIGYLNISEYVGMPKEQILTNYRILLNYLNTPWIANLDMPDFPSSASGLFHFTEVKKLFMLDYLVMITSGLGAFRFMQYLKREEQYWRLLRYFQWGVLLPLGVLTALLISFDTLFVLFHQVFFNNDAWLFNPATDPIILALPAEFFMHSFLMAFGLIEVLLVLGYFITKKRIANS